MKYARVHNYSHRASLSKYHKNESRYRRKPRQSSRQNSRHHGFKFYLAIGAILISCGLYVKYQSLYAQDSLFYSLYHSMIKPKWEEYQGKKTKKKRNVIAKDTSSKDTDISVTKTKQLRKKSAQAEPVSTIATKKKTLTPSSQIVGKQNAFYYTVSTKKDSNLLQLTPQKGTMVSLHEKDYYYNLVSRLVEYKNDQKQSLDVFSPKIILLKSWIENDTLLLDFNGAFQFSKLGDKGIILQIQQILWTIFRNSPEKIKYVSFLIEGKRKINLGGHGLRLKAFYSEKDLVRVINFPRKVH